MPVKMFGVTLWVILLSASVSGVIGRWNDDRTQSCDEEIKEMLHILTNEVAELKKEVQEMNRGRNPEEPKTKEPEKNTGGELKILSVNRKALVGQEGRYTVRYQVSGNMSLPVNAFWREFQGTEGRNLVETVSNKIPNLPPGVFETSTTTTAQNDSAIMVLIGHSNTHWLKLMLNNDDVNDITETDLETPLLDVIPKGDIVYEPGHNSTVTILYPHPHGAGSDENVDVHYDVVKPGLQMVITRRNDYILKETLLSLESKNELVDKIESKIKIKTDDTSYSGVLHFFSKVTKKTGLVRRIQNNKNVVLRPSTQERPFPDGKFYSMDSPSSERNENGDSVMYCEYGQTCKKFCQFYGNDLSSLELFKTVNATTTREDVEDLSLAQVTYTKLGLIKVSPVESDPSPVEYVCMVSDVKGNTSSSKTIVNFGYNVRILTEESSIETFSNLTAALVCTATGFPLPNVTISCMGTNAMTEIVYQSDHVIRVTATCRYYRNYSSAYCNAKNDYTSNSHRFKSM